MTHLIPQAVTRPLAATKAGGKLAAPALGLKSARRVGPGDLASRHGEWPSRLQPKLATSDPSDACEQEADRAADLVMRLPEPVSARPGGDPASMRPLSMQLKCAASDEGSRRKFDGPVAETPVSDLDAVATTLSQPGRPLDTSARAFFEPRFGVDFSAVRIHTDTQAAESARAIGALAYTAGRDVVFNAGQYAPQSDSGKRLLAHELTHVVQQNLAAGSTPGTLARQTSSGGSTAAPAGSMRTAKVWIHSFIPMATVADPFGRCYSGDSRGFDNAIHASYRTHQEVEFDAMSGAKTIDWSDVGVTHLVDCTSGVVRSAAKASAAGLVNGPVVSVGAGRYTINITGEASNPLAPIACAISLNLDVTIDTAARTCTVQGEHDGFPAYEVYVTADGGAGVPVYTYDPTVAGEEPMALCGGLDKTASGTARF